MKIYVDGELPKCCKECGFCCRGDLCYWCQGIGDGGFYIPDETLKEKRLSGCPLLTTQSLKQQVREQVVEEVRKQLKNMDFLANDTEFGERFSCYSKYKVLDVLLKVERNQVKGESNDN